MMVTPVLPIQLVVGLGNPGAEYARTRHNAGFWAVDELARIHHASWKYEARFHGEVAAFSMSTGKVYLLKPTTFMNRSGQSVVALAQFYRIPSESILVAHDELDLPPSSVRLKWAGGHAGHNGLKDIARLLGHPNIWRLRLGISHPGDRSRVADYVLSVPKSDEKIDIDRAIDGFIREWTCIQSGQFDKAMRTLHTNPPS